MRRRVATIFGQQSLRAKFGLLIGVLLAAIFVMAGVYLHAQQRASLRSLLRERSEVQLNLLAGAGAAAVLSGDQHTLNSYEQLGRDKDII